jgi:hypothetical protein
MNDAPNAPGGGERDETRGVDRPLGLVHFLLGRLAAGDGEQNHHEPRQREQASHAHRREYTPATYPIYVHL